MKVGNFKEFTHLPLFMKDIGLFLIFFRVFPSDV